MPRSFNGPVQIVLDCDSGLDAQNQPAMLFNPLTMDDEVRVSDVLNKVEQAESTTAAKQMVCDGLREYYDGAVNYPGDSFDANIKLLSIREAVETLTRLLYSSSLTTDEKKTSESQQPSGKGCLPADPAAKAAASIAHQIENPSTSNASTARDKDVEPAAEEDLSS